MPRSLRGLRVFDVDGHRLGRIVRQDEEVLAIDLTRRARRRFGAPADRLVVGMDDVVNADAEEVTLRESGRFLLHPERDARTPVRERVT